MGTPRDRGWLDTEHAILFVLRGSGTPLRARVLAERTGYSRGTIKNAVALMTKVGLVVNVERAGYELTEAGMRHPKIAGRIEIGFESSSGSASRVEVRAMEPDGTPVRLRFSDADENLPHVMRSVLAALDASPSPLRTGEILGLLPELLERANPMDAKESARARLKEVLRTLKRGAFAATVGGRVTAAKDGSSGPALRGSDGRYTLTDEGRELLRVLRRR